MIKTSGLFLFIVLIYCVRILYPVDKNYKLDLYNEILHQYVKNGLVDYKNLKNDNRLYEFINSLKITDPSDFKTKEEKLAFWINAYNAYTLYIICKNYPVESINDLSTGGKIIGYLLGATVWDKDFVEINHKKMTLNNIEHDIIRKEFNEPTIHFVLVCAAISCPPLRNEAYTGEKLDEQLNDQAKIFLNDKYKNYFDEENKTAHISKIFDWYNDDFGNNDKRILKLISQYLPEKLSNDIKANTTKWQIEYNNYNWDLNEAK